MQFYILIRDEEWEHVSEIKTALLDTLGHKYLVFSLFISIIFSLTHVCAICFRLMGKESSSMAAMMPA